ncbi:uncharacterized protein LOC114299566 [Camellia sinensis]|uniref:uncharacterized protein LOC114299566 n=1 Tax=Camellia sinensis TaxID=4442 RepID=UPI0010368B4F|nr:uncharacterized protein LOC114299566 [Camellia sinensis]
MVTSTEADPSPPTANAAHSGIDGKASVFFAISKNNTWIIDTGVSDHMTRDSGQLQFIFPSPQSVISTANGSTSPITREGSVILSQTLTLDIVLVVPSLEYNLLSVSQITSILACIVTFWLLFCVFEDILTWKILGYELPMSTYPQRSNKGVLKKQYEPDPKAKSKYPISNHVSSRRLSESCAFTVNQLSTVSIPSNVQDALTDPKWTKAMNEEMKALQMNATWEFVPLPE